MSFRGGGSSKVPPAPTQGLQRGPQGPDHRELSDASGMGLGFIPRAEGSHWQGLSTE